MRHISIFQSWRRWAQRLLMVGLVSMLGIAGVMAIAIHPSAAQVPLDSKEVVGQTKDELTGRTKDQPLNAEERLDRAYSISEGAGLREEKRQAEGKFNPREDNESLVEKAKDVLDTLTGK